VLNNFDIMSLRVGSNSILLFFLGVNFVLFLYNFSINAANTDRVARYINDCPRKYANCIPKSMFLLGKPRVLLFALRDIENGTELRYDYGGSLLPWRQVTNTCVFQY